MAQITRNMCEHIIKGFETKQGFPLTQWEAAQLAHTWIAREDERAAPTSAAGATNPHELTSSPEPAPALRAAEWVETANRLAEELETAAILYGDSEPGSIDESNDQHRMSAAREALRAHLSRASGLLPVAREGLRMLTVDEVQDCECSNEFQTARAVQRKFCEVNGIPQPASGDAPGEAK